MWARVFMRGLISSYLLQGWWHRWMKIVTSGCKMVEMDEVTHCMHAPSAYGELGGSREWKGAERGGTGVLGQQEN
jgi:hypothetical protein